MENTTPISPLQSLRERMIIAMSTAALTPILDKNHTNTHVADQIARFVDTFISNHEPNALIPVHVPHPLTEAVLRKVSRNGKITRTVPVDVEDFYPFDDAGREKYINEALIKEGDGKLTDITYRVVGFKDDGKVHFLEVTGTYTPPATDNPRGRKAIPVEIAKGKGRPAFTEPKSDLIEVEN